MLRKSVFRMWLAGLAGLGVACSDDSEPEPPKAVLIIDRPSLDFGEVDVGQASAEFLFTVRNASPTAVEAMSIEVDNPTFSITTNTCERFLDAGMECEVRVRFQPRTAGTFEGRLSVKGAPEVDDAALKGTGVAWVEVEGVSAGNRIVESTDAWSCDKPCRMPVRTTKVTLRAAPAGFPTWGGECASATGVTCTLTMDGTKRVSLQAVAPFYRWEVRRPSHPVSVAVLPGAGDILVQEIGSVTRLSDTGEVRWTRTLSGVTKLAMGASGNYYTVNYDGQVTRFDSNGNELWTWTPANAGVAWHELAAGPNGHVYVLLRQGDGLKESQLRLVALSEQGTERWSVPFNEAQLNLSVGLETDARGDVYLSGNAYNLDGERYVFVKAYTRKYSAEGALRWEKPDAWSFIAVSPLGMTSLILNGSGPAPGGFLQWMYDANGGLQWNTSTVSGPGLVDTQVFVPGGTMLVGGHQSVAGSEENGRGWFAMLHLQGRTPGPATFIETATGGGPVRLTGLAMTDVRHVVVTGGFGSRMGEGEGFVRFYDGRVLTTDVSQP
jgi:hypothetical protein